MLSASTLKLLACLFMFIDHVGVILFPGVPILRIIGRLAYPIFAFFIAEGCRHTSNKLRHFLSVFALGFVCQTVYVIYSGIWFLNILLTFSMSIPLVYLMQYCAAKKNAAWYCIFTAALAAVFVLTCYVDFDYGFAGMIAPLFAAAPDCFGIGFKQDTKDAHAVLSVKLGFFAIGIMLTCINALIGPIQMFALLSIPMLAMYSGRPGSKKLKYFFYIFYPLHLLLIEATAMLIK